MNLRVTIHLQNGTQIVTNADTDDHEVNDEFGYLETLNDSLDGRPGWRLIENVLAFSQTVAAVEAEQIG